MKGISIIYMSLLVSNMAAADLEEVQRSGLNMTNTIKSITNNLFNNMKSITDSLNIGDNEDLPSEEDYTKSNVVVDSSDGKIELNIDISHKELSEYLDSDYKLKYFRSAIHDIKERLLPIMNMETFYTLNNQRINGEHDEDFALELNKRIYWMVGELYYSQDPLKRNVVVLETNLNHLKDPEFRVSDFYFRGQYKSTENIIYQSNDESLQSFRKEYMLKKSQIMWNVADALKFAALLDKEIADLFALHHKIFVMYSTKAENRLDLKSLDDDMLDNVESLFDLRVKIVENIQLILSNINNFETYKAAFQKIFDEAEKRIRPKKEKAKRVEEPGINPEEYFKTKEQEIKDKSMQVTVEEKLNGGEIEMPDIGDGKLADNIITEPLLKAKPPVEEKFPTREPLEKSNSSIRTFGLITIGCLLKISIY